jgi:two-component system chemotaxis response regulator CheB
MKESAARGRSSPFPFPVVAMAPSTASLQALTEIMSALPKNFPAAIIVVQHLSLLHKKSLPEILARHTYLRIKQIEAGEPLQPATVYVAPPGK